MQISSEQLRLKRDISLLSTFPAELESKTFLTETIVEDIKDEREPKTNSEFKNKERVFLDVKVVGKHAYSMSHNKIKLTTEQI